MSEYSGFPSYQTLPFYHDLHIFDLVCIRSLTGPPRLVMRELKAATTATATKTSVENEHLRNGDYFVNIASSSHPLLLTEHAANALVEAPLK